ncbi:YybH family protein [Streptomyces sp. CA-106131]|uniref:YybH family protein n=1 Tax=Streptomyces sp. CA-106131 TaxID=3240045 RepID=UPI003D8E93D2
MTTTQDQEQIRTLLAAYEKSLNTSDAKAAEAVYADDGVFYPYNLPTAAGGELRGSYESIFKVIRLNITFTVHEIVVDGALAYATTGSRGEVTILADNVTVPEENREVFVFRKADGEWKIARYMFNKSEASAG